MRPPGRFRPLLAVALLGISGAAHAADETAPLGPPIAELLAANPSAANHPRDDIVVLFQGVDVRLEPDGRVRRRIRIVQRLLTDLAITRQGDLRIAYDTTLQSLEIGICRTFMRDGKEVAAEPRSFNRTTPERVAACPDRMSLQEMVVSFLGVERGCLTEIEYTLRDRVAWRPWLEGIEDLGAAAPVLAGEIRIACPDPSPWHAALSGVPADVAIAGAGETGPTRTWRYGPMPPFPDEGGLPAAIAVPRLVYSTCPSWDAVISLVRDRVRAAAVPDSAIDAWAHAPLPSGRPALDDADRMRKVAWLLRERTLAADDPAWQWFLPVRPAARTFDTSCGSLLDRAALGLAVLRASGLEARPVLRPGGPAVERSVPCAAQFDELWLAQGEWFLAVGEGFAGPRPDPGWAEELLDRRDCETGFAPLPPRKASCSLALRLHENENGTVKGEARVRAGGFLCRGIGHEDLKGFLSGLAGGYARGGGLSGYRVDALTADTLDVTFSLTGAGIGDSLGGGRSRFALSPGPGLPHGTWPAGPSLLRETRRTQLLLPFSLNEDVRVRIEPSAATRVVIVPASCRMEGAGVSLEITVDQRDSAIVLTRRFTAGGRMIEPAAYPMFREAMLRRGDPAPSLYLEKTARNGEEPR